MERGPTPPAPERKKLTAAIVENAEAVRSAARDAAESEMVRGRQSMEKWNTLAGIKKRLWTYGLGARLTLIGETEKAQQKIVESRNLHAAEDAGSEAHKQTTGALIQRFTSEYDEAVHTEAGEKRHDEDLEGRYSARITELILQFGRDEIDEENFIEEKNRVIAEAFGWKNSDKARAAVYHADNLLEIAKEVKLAVSHGEGIDRLAADLNIVIGRAKSGVRTEANFNWQDRLVEKIQSTRMGAFVPEATLSAAVAITGLVAERVFRSKAAAWGTFGASAAVGGFIVGTKENARLKAERARFAREKAQGKNVTLNPEKEEQEQYRYQSESASEMTLGLHSLENTDLSQAENFLQASRTLAYVEGRIRLSDRQKIDLISYTNVASVEKERFELDVARAKIKVALRRAANTNSSLIGGAGTVEAMWQRGAGLVAHHLTEGDIAERDRLFNKMKAKRVATATAIGLGIGLAVGATVQEASAAAFHNQQGLVHGAGRSTYEALPTGVTALQSLKMWLSGEAYGGSPPKLIQYDLPPNGEGKLKLPEGLQLVVDKDDITKWSLQREGDKSLIPLKHLRTDGHGHLTKESVDALKGQGIGYHEDIINEPKKTIQTIQHKPEEYAKLHTDSKKPDSFHHIAREFWYDQNSPYKSIGNALKLHWGGAQGTGIDKDGNYVFNVFKMTPGGSFHGNNALNAQKAIKGENLKMLLSMTCDTQTYVVEVPIRSDGTAVVDPSSSIGKMFFAKDPQGHAVFKGQYAEVGLQVPRTAEDPREHFRILATHGGKGDVVIPKSSIEVDATKHIPVTTLTPPEQEHYFAPPPVIPVYKPRIRPVEREVNSYENGELPPEEQEAARARMSENLRNNPEAQLDHYEEAKKYLNRQNEEYTEKIVNLLSDTQPMDPECRLAICIPVAGHEEGEHIYKTLESFLNQTADKKSFEINLYVNRPEKDRNDNPIQPDKTLNEIARFKAEHPELRINVIQEVLPNAEAKIGNIRKTLNDGVLTRHHERGPGVPDLIMVSNDADIVGMAPEYVENFIKKFEADPNIDAMYGQLDWDPMAYIRNPLLHVGHRLLQYVYVQMQRKEGGPSYPGANFAFRSSIYAAIGGYNENKDIGEDVDIGQRIIFGRDSRYAIAFAGARISRLYTSARRSEKNFEEGFRSRAEWEKGFSAVNDEVRKVKWDSRGRRFDFSNIEDRKRLEKGLVEVISQTLDGLRSTNRNERNMQANALRWLGITYQVQPDGRFRITENDVKGLVEDLKNYQEEGEEIFRRKIGQPIPENEAEPELPSTEPITVKLEFGNFGAGVGNLATDGFEARISNNSKGEDALAVSADKKVFVVADGLGGSGAFYHDGQTAKWARAVAEAVARRGDIASLTKGNNLRNFVLQVKTDLESQGVSFENTSRVKSSMAGVLTTLTAAERVGENTFSILAVGDSPLYVINQAGTVIKQYGEDVLKGSNDDKMANAIGMNGKGQIKRISKPQFVANEKIELRRGQLLVLATDFFSDYTDRGGNLKQYIGNQPEAFHNMAMDPTMRAKVDDATLVVIDPYKLPWEENAEARQAAAA